MKPITIEECNKLIESDEIQHEQPVIFPHKFCPNYYEESEEDCDGEVYWEAVLEGLVCTKCNLYTGIK